MAETNVINLGVFTRSAALAAATNHADYLTQWATAVLSDFKRRLPEEGEPPATLREIAEDLLLCLSDIRTLVVRLRLDPGMVDEHQEGLKAIQVEVEREIEFVRSLLH